MQRLWVVAFLVSSCAPRAPGLRWYDRPLPMDLRSVEVVADGQSVAVTYGIVGTARCRARPTPCPMMILLPGGAQNVQLMQETARPWAADLRDSGWLVLSPAASAERTFYEEGDSGLDGWLLAMLDTYRPGRCPVLVGVSNGGIAAFRILARRPKAFEQVLVLPGYLPDGVRLDSRTAPVTLVVGERDSWSRVVRRSAASLRTGPGSVRMVTLPDVGHALFDRVDATYLLDLIERQAEQATCRR